MNDTAERRLSEALQDLALGQPFTPDVAGVERRGRWLRRRRWLARAGTGAAAATVVTVVALSTSATAPTPTPAPTIGVAPAQPALASAPLTRLADAVLASAEPVTGDATLVLRHQRYSGQEKTVADLYADDGTYYFAQTATGLKAEVAGHHDRANGVFGREVAAAVEVANGGDVATGRTKMAHAALDPGTSAPRVSELVTNNWVWGSSLDAFTAGGGRADVRAGVLRILGTIRAVKVTETTTGGQPTLTLVAGDTVFPNAYEEKLVVRADNGVPVAFSGGRPGRKPQSTVTYEVSRVTLADVAAGKS